MLALIAALVQIYKRLKDYDLEMLNKHMICELHPEHGEMQYIGRGWSKDFGCDVNLWDCSKCSFSKRIPVEGTKYTPLGVDNNEISN